LTSVEVLDDYERQTGLVIVETFRTSGVSADEVPAVLVANHAPFTWGSDPFVAVAMAGVLEVLARMELSLRAIAPDAVKPETTLVDKHYFRKHGSSAYYGQGR
jgi:L-ribulose-5-phosphate 4-epimerase